MTLKIGINGFGRIGRLALRAAWDWPELEFIQINDPAGDAATHAHLLNFDSVHGRWQHEASSDGNCIESSAAASAIARGDVDNSSPCSHLRNPPLSTPPSIHEMVSLQLIDKTFD